MITVFEKEKVFALCNGGVSAVFGVGKDGTLRFFHFGKEVNPEDFKADFSSASFGKKEETDETTRFHAHYALSENAPYEFRSPALTIKGADGFYETKFVFTGAKKLNALPKPAGLPTARAGETLAFTSKEERLGLDLTQYFSLTEEGALITYYTVENNGKDAVKVEKAFSFNVYIPNAGRDTVSTWGSWGKENQISRTPLGKGVFSVDSFTGTTSPFHNNFLIVCDKTATETGGEAYGAALVYTGAFKMQAESAIYDEVVLSGGLNDRGFSYHLGVGETFTVPEAVLVYSDEGLGKMSRVYHDVIRSKIMPERFAYEKRPVIFNIWEGVTFTFTEQTLFKFIDVIGKTGVDTFVVDDGWFGKRNDDKAGLGDWFVNEEKLKGGLKPIVDYCHEKGMKFGIWFEPEMVNPDSDLFRVHPDWVLSNPTVAPYIGRDTRNQYCLDITRKDVRDYLVDAINKIIRDYGVDYVKWDHNRHVSDAYMKTLPVEKQGETYYRYTLGAYDLFERIVNANPTVFFEGCSSGGTRFDMGMAYYFPQIWTSDMAEAVERTRIQYGASLIYPLSLQSCHVARSPYSVNGRRTSVKTRGDIAHLGAFGYEFDPTEVPEEEVAAIPEQIAEYKKWEDLVVSGDLYRLKSPFEYGANGGGDFIEELVSKDKSRAQVTVFRHHTRPYSGSLSVKLCGLDENARYRVAETGDVLSGSTLTGYGLKVSEPEKRLDFQTTVFHFEKV